MYQEINIYQLDFKQRKLLADYLNISQTQLIIESRQSLRLDKSQYHQIQQKFQLLQKNYPLDYLLSKITFAKLQVKINPKVFIPRPETEDWILKIQTQQIKLKKTSVLVDLCCGSGVIGLSLQDFFDQVWLVDISLRALQNTYQNISINFPGLGENKDKLSKNKFLLFKPHKTKNLLTKIPKTNWTLICNPPYVPTTDILDLEKNNLQFEPSKAIFSGEDGLDLTRSLIGNLQQWSQKQALPSQLILELDPRNIYKAKKAIQIFYPSTQILTDFNGLDRVLICNF